MKLPPKTTASYIASYPAKVQKILHKVRATIRKAAPEASEKISYGIPTFVLHHNRVHFAAWKNHLSVYPGSSAIQEFKRELKPYEVSRGTVKFPLDEPIPFALIAKMVKSPRQKKQAKSEQEEKHVIPSEAEGEVEDPQQNLEAKFREIINTSLPKK